MWVNARTPSDVLLLAEHWLLQGGGGGGGKAETKTRGRSCERKNHSSSPAVTATQHPPPTTSSMAHAAVPLKRTISTPSSHQKASPIPEPKPIPKDFVYHIRKAYGASTDIDLCKDILELPSSSAYSQTQLRVAYFRKGRAVLQQQQSSPTSVVQSPAVTPKQRFQAVTKAYEILTHPGYRAYYELYGLPSWKGNERRPSPVVQSPVPQPYHAKEAENHKEDRNDDFEGEDDDEDGAVSVASSTASGGSILRRQTRPLQTRSRSWGPRTRVVWKEVVQELVYQPDPPVIPVREVEPRAMNEPMMPSSSTEWSHGHDSDSRRRFDEDLQQVEATDFLDDFELSVLEIGKKFENFVKYLSDDESSTNEKSMSRDCAHKADASRDHIVNRAPDPDGICCENRSSLARQLFPYAPPTIPQPVDPFGSAQGGAYKKRIADHRRCRSVDTESFTATAPLKQGKLDRLPRIKPKKSKRHQKRGVDRVPSSFEDAHPIDTFDPFQNSFDGSVDRNAINDLAETWSALGSATPTELSATPIAGKSQIVDPYALPEESSILESIVSDSSQKINFFASKLISFDDALNQTSDATTKGFLRLDRHAVDGSKSPEASIKKDVPLLDLSDITFSSNVSDDPVGRHVHGFLTGFTQSAKETIRDIASFDEEGDEMRTASEDMAPNTNQTAPNNADDIPFLSKLNGYMQLLVDDMNKVGTQMSTNLQEAGRVVRESIALPEADVAGMLRVLEQELQWKKEETPTQSEDIHQSFTY